MLGRVSLNVGVLVFAPNMVTNRFALAARQIRVCVIFHPMGDERTAPQKSDEKWIDNCVPSARVRVCLGLWLAASRASEASHLAHCCGRSTISAREIISCHLPASRRSVPMPDATLCTWCLEWPRFAGSSPVTPRSSITTRGGQVQARLSSLSPSSLRADGAIKTSSSISFWAFVCACVCPWAPSKVTTV